MLMIQIRSMDHELTKYNTRLFAEKVLPHVRDIWDNQWRRPLVAPGPDARRCRRPQTACS